MNLIQKIKDIKMFAQLTEESSFQQGQTTAAGNYLVWYWNSYMTQKLYNRIAKTMHIWQPVHGADFYFISKRFLNTGAEHPDTGLESEPLKAEPLKEKSTADAKALKLLAKEVKGLRHFIMDKPVINMYAGVGANSSIRQGLMEDNKNGGPMMVPGKPLFEGVRDFHKMVSVDTFIASIATHKKAVELGVFEPVTIVGKVNTATIHNLFHLGFNLTEIKGEGAFKVTTRDKKPNQVVVTEEGMLDLVDPIPTKPVNRQEPGEIWSYQALVNLLHAGSVFEWGESVKVMYKHRGELELADITFLNSHDLVPLQLEPGILRVRRSDEDAKTVTMKKGVAVGPTEHAGVWPPVITDGYPPLQPNGESWTMLGLVNQLESGLKIPPSQFVRVHGTAITAPERLYLQSKGLQWNEVGGKLIIKKEADPEPSLLQMEVDAARAADQATQPVKPIVVHTDGPSPIAEQQMIEKTAAMPMGRPYDDEPHVSHNPFGEEVDKTEPGLRVTMNWHEFKRQVESEELTHEMVSKNPVIVWCSNNLKVSANISWLRSCGFNYEKIGADRIRVTSVEKVDKAKPPVEGKSVVYKFVYALETPAMVDAIAKGTFEAVDFKMDDVEDFDAENSISLGEHVVSRGLKWKWKWARSTKKGGGVFRVYQDEDPIDGETSAFGAV